MPSSNSTGMIALSWSVVRSGKPQNQMLLLVMSAARSCWKAYGAHHPLGEARMKKPLTSPKTQAKAASDQPTPCRSRAAQRSSSSGSRKNSGQNFRAAPTASQAPAQA